MPIIQEITMHTNIIHNYETKLRLYEIETEVAIGFIHETVGPKLKEKFNHFIYSKSLTHKEIVKWHFRWYL